MRVVALHASKQEGVFCAAVVRQMVGEVIPTRVQLTFSQCQNYLADISVERNFTYFFWGHADVALLATTPKKSFAEEVGGRGSLPVPVRPVVGCRDCYTARHSKHFAN